LLQSGDIGKASENAEAGCAIAQGLMARNAHYQGWRAGARQCWILRAEIALGTNSKNQALIFANKAIRSAAVVSSSDRAADKYGLSKAYLVLGDVERSLGDPAAAASAWQQALHELPAGVAEQPVELDQHAKILERVGDSAQAQRIAARLNAMGYRRGD
jgi:tetratricopeptide (TPR) repeat protein